MLILLGVVALFGAYMLWPSGGGLPVEPSPDDSSPSPPPESTPQETGSLGGPRPVFEGTDQRGISISGGGGDINNPGVFQTASPVVTGTLVGFGTKTDLRGEYLISYVRVEDTSGYEVDMRTILGYSTDLPSYLNEGDQVRVYGEFTSEREIKAQAVQ